MPTMPPGVFTPATLRATFPPDEVTGEIAFALNLADGQVVRYCLDRRSALWLAEGVISALAQEAELLALIPEEDRRLMAPEGSPSPTVSTSKPSFRELQDAARARKARAVGEGS